MPLSPSEDPQAKHHRSLQQSHFSAQRFVGNALLGIVVMTWAWGLSFYFWKKEGLFDWTPANGPGLPEKLLGGRFATALNYLTAPFSVVWSNVPWIELGISLAMIVAYMALGALLLSGSRMELPPLARICTSLPLGAGAVGYATMLVGLMGQLHRWPVVGAWAVLAVIGFVLLKRKKHRARIECGGNDWMAKVRREQQSIAAQAYRRQVTVPLSSFDLLFCAAAMILIAVISGLIFIHAIGQTETYWDSLILYMGYARKMFLQHGYPVKVVGQVGIGLGANYPHLYPTLTAQTAAMAGYWSDSFAQMLPPIASLVSTLFVYLIAQELTRNRVVGWASALLFRAVPYGISYGQYASDYALAIMYTAAFLYFALLYLRYGNAGALWLMFLMAAFAVNINYLMGALWPLGGMVAVLAHLPSRVAPDSDAKVLRDEWDELESFDSAPSPSRGNPITDLFEKERLPLGRFLRSQWLWLPVGVSLLVACPWYIRNILLTGNPVYAFFYNLFPSKHVNPDVMKSAEVEWLMNGDGLGRVGQTVAEKLSNSWLFFVTGNQHWKLAPVFMGFVVPGVLICSIFLIMMVFKTRRETPDAAFQGSKRFALVSLSLFFLLWFYAYVVADFYLYQIIVVLPLFGVFAGWLLNRITFRPARAALLMLVLCIGFAPGVVMALMGAKLTGGHNTMRTMAPQLELTALRHLFLPADTLLTYQYNGDMRALDWVNGLPSGRRILTHENRHLLLNERLNIVHLDDWEVQAAYGKPIEERLRILDDLGIDYYFYVTNEDKHRANSWLGMDELIGHGDFKLIEQWPSGGSSSREGLDYKNIPPDVNALYRRER